MTKWLLLIIGDITELVGILCFCAHVCCFQTPLIVDRREPLGLSVAGGCACGYELWHCDVVLYRRHCEGIGNDKRRNGYFAGLCGSLETPAIVCHVCGRSVVAFGLFAGL